MTAAALDRDLPLRVGSELAGSGTKAVPAGGLLL